MSNYPELTTLKDSERKTCRSFGLSRWAIAGGRVKSTVTVAKVIWRGAFSQGVKFIRLPR